ncbi:uncharacterized protein DS421_18g616390 [Arachis hypogaea]|nr:uncharacterized protein DS421_18g616390 [Arachis hypogaea]
MNSHHFGYEFGSNYVVGDGSFNDSMRQGFGDQGLTRVLGDMTTLLTEMRKDQKAFYAIRAVQAPPQHDYSSNSYGYNPNPNAFQSNVCDDPYCDGQPQPSYTYEPPPQPQQPYSQASYHHSPPYDPSLYTPYQPPYEPYLEPPPFQHQYSHELQFSHIPPQEFHQYEPPSNYNTFSSNNEPSLPPLPSDEASMLELRDLESHVLRQQEWTKKQFKELEAKMAIIAEAVSNMVSSRLSLCDQGTPIVECGEATKELSGEVILELQGEEEELKQEVQQEEEVENIEQKEVVVGYLGYVEYIEESQVEKPSSMEFKVDVEEESAQPPRHNVIEELEEVSQVIGPSIYDDSASIYDPFELDESFPTMLGIDEGVDFTKLPIYDLSDGKR